MHNILAFKSFYNEAYEQIKAGMGSDQRKLALAVMAAFNHMNQGEDEHSDLDMEMARIMITEMIVSRDQVEPLETFLDVLPQVPEVVWRIGMDLMYRRAQSEYGLNFN